MMKRFTSLYYIALSALLMLTACQSDETTEQSGGQQPGDGKIGVHLRMGVAGSQATRAWEDGTNAVTAEMMNVWTVVVVNDDDTDVNYNKVVSIYACKPSGEPDQEIDDYVELPAAGTYRFYSFANMSPKVVMSLLGIDGSGSATPKARTRDASAGTAYDDMPSQGTTDNDNNATGSVTSYAGDDDDFYSETYTTNTYYSIAYTENATVTADYANGKTVNMAGNNFDVTTANGYGAVGIPMSNVQTIEVNSSTETIDLIVIRMMAKIELQVYNERGSNVTIESFTLTDVTANTNGNLKLLPNLSAEGHGSMEVTTHGDIRPNLGSATQKDLTLYPSSEQGAVSATANNTSGTPVSFTFYVNESATPGNGYGLFYLKIKLSGDPEEHYALIDHKGKTTADDNKWNYIARNDYRIIPVVLDDYKIDIIPYDFPAIGVYPASVKEEDGLFTINFHDYGHFHLVPQVTKVSTSAVVPFTATTPDYSSTTWGLVGNSFASSWRSWTDATKATEYDNSTASPAFYRTGTDSYITTTTDGDEVGGEPVWYPNTTGNPQWDPAGGTTYNPFIFGYIADPGSALSEDRKVYHEFTINLYKQGMSVPRQMTYRLLMILDTDQMLYGSRRLGNAPSRHTHGF